jgi:hypothetical protein
MVPANENSNPNHLRTNTEERGKSNAFKATEKSNAFKAKEAITVYDHIYI